MHSSNHPLSKAYGAVCERIGQTYDGMVAEGLSSLVPASFIEIPFETPGHAHRFAKEFHRSCHEFGVEVTSHDRIVFVTRH